MSRTNICLQSEAIDGAPWSVIGGAVDVTANAAVAPNGTTTAEELGRINAATNGKYQTIALTPDMPYAGSAFFKSVDSDQSNLTILNHAFGLIAELRFTWTAGVPSTSSSSGASRIVYEPFDDDWYRVSYAFTSNSAHANNILTLYPSHAGGANGQSCYVWGAQMETGLFATRYIKTEAAAVTKTGADFIQRLDRPLARHISTVW